MNDNKLKIIDSRSGTLLVVVFVIMSAVFLLITYFLQFILSEVKIAQSHIMSVKSYYLTEAGIHEAMWKIKNNPAWNNGFQTDPQWSASIAHSDIFNSGYNFNVSLNNIDLGNAELSSTSTISFAGVQAQRVVKINAFQALGMVENGATTTAIFTDQDMLFSGTDLTVIGEGIFANDDINLSFFSDIQIEGKAQAVDNISIPWGSTLSASAVESANYPPASVSQEMPQIDFDSDDPGSLLSQADYVYSTGQFQSLMSNNETLNFSGIVYVTGNINIPRGVQINIDGALVSEGHINLGTEWWPGWKNAPRLTITDPGTGPAGLISQRRIYFASQAQAINIDGLIYALDDVRADWLSPDINLNGGIITRNLNISNYFNPIVITYNEDAIKRTLGLATESPVINVDHWEEEY